MTLFYDSLSISQWHTLFVVETLTIKTIRFLILNQLLEQYLEPKSI